MTRSGAGRGDGIGVGRDYQSFYNHQTRLYDVSFHPGAGRGDGLGDVRGGGGARGAQWGRGQPRPPLRPPPGPALRGLRRRPRHLRLLLKVSDPWDLDSTEGQEQELGANKIVKAGSFEMPSKRLYRADSPNLMS